eukprot:16432806-Heterocapsa_arctica.AAC.1
MGSSLTTTCCTLPSALPTTTTTTIATTTTTMTTRTTHADNIRWSTGTEGRTGTTSTKLKDAEAKLTDNADICEKRVAGIIRQSCRQQARAKERASSHRVELNALRGRTTLAVSE